MAQVTCHVGGNEDKTPPGGAADGPVAAPAAAPRRAQAPYAPGHGPGVATSGSTSVFVSKSRKPRRR